MALMALARHSQLGVRFCRLSKTKGASPATQGMVSSMFWGSSTVGAPPATAVDEEPLLFPDEVRPAHWRSLPSPA